MKSVLATQPQLGDEGSIPLDVLPAEVVEETTPFSDHHQESATTVMVVLVLTEMLGQVVDPLAEQGNLHLWRACVALMSAELGDDLGGCLHCA